MAFFSSSLDPIIKVTDEKNGTNISLLSFQTNIPMSSLTNDFCSGSSVVQGAQALYRGFLLGEYVYSLGSPPGGGATDIIIVGYPSADT